MSCLITKVSYYYRQSPENEVGKISSTSLICVMLFAFHSEYYNKQEKKNNVTLVTNNFL